MIKVDTLELPDSMRGQSMKLVASGANRYELYDADDEFLLRGTVGEVASLDLGGGENLTLFVSVASGRTGPGLLDSETPTRQQHPVAAGQSHSRGARRLVRHPRDQRDRAQTRSACKSRSTRSRTSMCGKTSSASPKKHRRRWSSSTSSCRSFDRTMEAAELALNSYRLEKGSIDLPLETQTVLQTIVSIEAQIEQACGRNARRSGRRLPKCIRPSSLWTGRSSRLNAELDDLNAQVRDLPTTQQEVLRLIRDVEVTTASTARCLIPPRNCAWSKPARSVTCGSSTTR